MRAGVLDCASPLKPSPHSSALALAIEAAGLKKNGGAQPGKGGWGLIEGEVGLWNEFSGWGLGERLVCWVYGT